MAVIIKGKTIIGKRPVDQPILLFDFYQTSHYNNGDSSVADLSGFDNNGVPVVGTGGGSPTTVSGYNTSPFGYLFTDSSTSNQLSIRLPSNLSLPGVSKYTIMGWATNTNLTFGSDVYQGLVASSELNFGNYALGMYYVGSDYVVYHQRANDVEPPTQQGFITLSFGSTITPSFVADKYYFFVAGYDGSKMYLSVYVDDVRYDSSTLDQTPIGNHTPSVGLRYNNWWNGNIGYISIYDEWIGYAQINLIYNSTKARYV